jgi:hypothetical protein
MNLSSDQNYYIASAPVGTGTTDVVSAIIDCESADVCMFALNMGVVGAGNVATVRESDDPAMAGATTVGTTITGITLDVTANRITLIECIQPLKRYLQLTITRPGASVVNTIHAITRKKKRPTVQSTSHVSGTVRLIKGQ